MKQTIVSAAALLASVSGTAAFAAPPAPIAAEQWITAADNHPDAARLGLEGTVLVELAVTERGDIAGCQVVKGSGHSLLDQHTCRLLTMRAQFKPATDKNGKPVAGVVPHSVGWQVITNENWAGNGLVRAEMSFDRARGQGGDCAAEIVGEVSEHMKQMACFVLLNQAKNISAALAQEQDTPFTVGFLLAVYPEAGEALTKEGVRLEGKRVGYARAALAVGPSGLRMDCQMAETEGPASLIFPICGANPPFRYVPAKDRSGANVATEMRQEVTYYAKNSLKASRN